MIPAQQIVKKINELSEQEAKMLLVEIFNTRNYSNQEMIQTINEMVERLKMNVE